MPYVYEFTKGAHRFSCELRCGRCEATTRGGGRCRARTCIGTPLCWMHLLSAKNLRVKPSALPGAGKGLFAVARRLPAGGIVFRRGDVVCEYGGDPVSMATLDARYPDDATAPYGVEQDAAADRYENAACRRGVGSLANHAPGAASNARYWRSPADGRVHLRATRAIRNGDEVLCDYGSAYQVHEPGTTSRTTRRRRR